MIKDGDIFRWRYKDEKPEHLGPYKRYHCKSQIAIADGGHLRDTFWNSRGEGFLCPYDEAERTLELTHIGNLSELENRPEYEAASYADADCLDLNHSNSSKGNFYVRKGAERSREKMIATVTLRMADAERDIASAQSRLERHRATLFELKNGKSVDDVCL